MSQRKIQLILRDAGLASRRKAEGIIRSGRVTLNGTVVMDPAQTADPDRDHIKVDGKLIRPRVGPSSYVIFNKPRNVVSTLSDPQGRPCVGDFVKRMRKRLFPVGRLDFDAEGLMILTDDGALAQKLSHPSNRIPRTYMVKVKGSPDLSKLKGIQSGMHLGDGDHLGEVRWTIIKGAKSSTWIKVTLFEGKKNELKRMFVRIGHPVRKIRRVRFGPFRLGKLASGTWRDPTDAEELQLSSLLR